MAHKHPVKIPQLVLHLLRIMWCPFSACLRALGSFRYWLSRRFTVLIRSIGLGIITIVNQGEPRKVLVNQSRKLALARCGVHMLPACVSIIIVVINVQGYFIGNELQGALDGDGLKLAAMQIAAKIQVGIFRLFFVASWCKGLTMSSGTFSGCQCSNHHISCDPISIALWRWSPARPRKLRLVFYTTKVLGLLRSI
jgi:hypothetical protein